MCPLMSLCPQDIPWWRHRGHPRVSPRPLYPPTAGPVGDVPTCRRVPFPQDGDPAVTPAAELCAEARAAAQRLLDHYVQVQGAAVAQMLRKSVETRDWLGTVEPRNVRAVMKRVVEDITAIDVQVGDRGPQVPWRGPDIPEGPWRDPEVPEGAGGNP